MISIQRCNHVLKLNYTKTYTRNSENYKIERFKLIIRI